MRLLVFFGVLFYLQLPAQTIGGNAVFNFLRLPSSPQQTALGGTNTSYISDDVSFAFNNPALLRPSMHTQVATVFTSLYDGISAYHLSMAYHHEKSETDILGGLNYINYGNLSQTDAAGNLLGSFRPVDWVMQVSAARGYLEKWRYGASLKFIHSNYGQYRSSGIAMDVGILYHDTASLFSASLLAKNMGTQLKKYDGTDPDDLPFDLQAGVSKRLKYAPIGFSFTAHHLHRFAIDYNDVAFNEENGFVTNATSKFTLDNLFRHFVFATNIYLGDNVQVDIGYNYLQRKELNIGTSGNGLTGFSMGAHLLLEKLQVRYARTQYQNNSAYNQFGINLTLNKYFGLGKWGERVGW